MTLIRDAISIGSQRVKTPEGFLRAPAHIGRVGILAYAPGDPAMAGAPANLAGREIRILRSESEVFAPAAMDSFIGRPVLNEHSAPKITPDNFRQHIVGVTGSNVVRDGQFVKADLTIFDAAMIAAIESGKVQLSQGYDAQIDWTPGTDPMFGAYDGAFKSIVGNHVAVTDSGRSGPGVKILDSNKESKSMKRTINGVEIDIPDNVVGVVDSYLAANAANEKALGEANGKIAALDKQVADLTKQIATVTDSAYLDKRVAERSALVADAKRVAPAVVCDGLTDDAIRAAVVEAKGIKGMDAAGNRGAFAALVAATPVPTPAAAVTQAVNDSTGESPESIYNKARAAFVAGK